MLVFICNVYNPAFDGFCIFADKHISIYTLEPAEISIGTVIVNSFPFIDGAWFKICPVGGGHFTESGLPPPHIGVVEIYIEPGEIVDGTLVSAGKTIDIVPIFACNAGLEDDVLKWIKYCAFNLIAFGLGKTDLKSAGGLKPGNATESTML